MNRYIIHTFGCQMNKHDSERMAGLLESHGYIAARSDDEADVIVFNTCAVRETADDRMYGQVASLKAIKTGGRPEVIIAVGGCVGQRDGEEMLRRLPHVDVVFGTHNIEDLPSLIEAAASGSPTSVTAGRARVLRSASTSTMAPSRPISAQLWTLASTAGSPGDGGNAQRSLATINRRAP